MELAIPSLRTFSLLVNFTKISSGWWLKQSKRCSSHENSLQRFQLVQSSDLSTTDRKIYRQRLAEVILYFRWAKWVRAQKPKELSLSSTYFNACTHFSGDLLPFKSPFEALRRRESSDHLITSYLASDWVRQFYPLHSNSNNSNQHLRQPKRTPPSNGVSSKSDFVIVQLLWMVIHKLNKPRSNIAFLSDKLIAACFLHYSDVAVYLKTLNLAGSWFKTT